MSFQQEISLFDLPRYSPWPSRILGLGEGFLGKGRTAEKVLREYSAKWARLYATFEEHSYPDMDACLWGLVRAHFPEKLLIHRHERVFQVDTTRDFWNDFYDVICRVLKPLLGQADRVVELGCGWGRNLFYLQNQGLCRHIAGGDLVADGVELASRIADRYGLSAHFGLFDYNAPGGELDQHIENSVVFTHNSIEQIPYLRDEFLEYLIEKRVHCVVHLEPVSELHGSDNMMHLLWKKYTEINDYNRNLLSLLRKFEDIGKIRINAIMPHQLGLNAFNGCSIIVWEPVAARGCS